MTTQRPPRKTPALVIPNLPLPPGADSSARWMIGAILAAGKDGCACDACQMLKKLGSALSESLLKEEPGDGNLNPV